MVVASFMLLRRLKRLGGLCWMILFLGGRGSAVRREKSSRDFKNIDSVQWSLELCGQSGVGKDSRRFQG